MIESTKMKKNNTKQNKSNDTKNKEIKLNCACYVVRAQ